MDVDPPEGWVDDAEEFGGIDETFNGEDLYDLPKPYKTLLVNAWSDDDFIIQCGTPDEEDPKKFCYVFYHRESDTVCRVVHPTKTDDLWTALTYWDNDYERDKCVRYEKFLVMDHESSDENFSKTVLTFPPAPRGWIGHPREVQFLDSFNKNGLFILPRPYHGLLSDDTHNIFLIQCGIPGSDDSSQFCYVLYFLASESVVQIESPANIEEMWRALSYWMTEEHKEKSVRTGSVLTDENFARRGKSPHPKGSEE